MVSGAMTGLTKHGKKRMKERNGLHGKAALRMSQKALETGYRRADTKRRLRKWMDQIDTYSDKTFPVLYGDKCYIFSPQHFLVTVINVPSDLTKDMKKMIVSCKDPK